METQIVGNIAKAEAIANLILKEMGDCFFTIAEMKKKIVKQNNDVNSRHPNFNQKLTWKEAQDYIDYLIQWAFCEALKEGNNNIYRIRTDVGYRQVIYEAKKKELQERISVINIVLSLLDTEHLKHAPKKAAKKTAKKVVKKTTKEINKKSAK